MQPVAQKIKPISAHAENQKVFCAQCGVVIEALKEFRCFWCVEEICWLCWEKGMGQCVSCARTIAAVPKVAKMAKPKRVRYRGRPAKIATCRCGEPLTATERRSHVCASMTEKEIRAVRTHRRPN